MPFILFEEYFRNYAIIIIQFTSRACCVGLKDFRAFYSKRFSYYIENCAFLATLERTTNSPSTSAATSSDPRRCATRVAAFVLIVRRMIHGVLRHGDHPRNILSRVGYQPHVSSPSLSSGAEAEGHCLQTTCPSEIRRMKGIICSPAKYREGCTATNIRRQERDNVTCEIQERAA